MMITMRMPRIRKSKINRYQGEGGRLASFSLCITSIVQKACDISFCIPIVKLRAIYRSGIDFIEQKSGLF